jgi:EAL domain-containing protein (putative c-di-GMP-specific phosphodiesterase class I)
VPFYQPQIDFETSRIVGFEMLARWNHPSGRLVGPDVFIPVAEETGLIGELSEGLIRQALADAIDWGPAVTLSVNISPVQLRDSSLPAKIADLLYESRFPADRLDLEITESSLIENLPLAQTVTRELKGLGVTITMDDFGTGYSSLAHLRALPFDRIKIDRSFSLSLNRDPESGVIVRAIVNLAHNLGLPVTAEGVESAATDLRLRGLGCDRGQGWLFGKATPAASARALLRDQAAMDVWRGAPAFLTVADRAASARAAMCRGVQREGPTGVSKPR